MSYDDHHLTDSVEELWSRFRMLVDVAVMLSEEEDQRRLLAEKDEDSKFHKTDSVDESHKRIFYLFPRRTISSLVRRRDTEQNPNGASTSSSLLLDLNKIPTDSESQNPSSESEPVVYDEEQRAKKGKSKIIVCEEDNDQENEKRLFEKNLCNKFVSRRYLQKHYVTNLNGASTSNSSFLNLRCFEPSLLFDYNTAEYEKTETKDSQNPNYQTSPSSCLTENTSHKSNSLICFSLVY